MDLPDAAIGAHAGEEQGTLVTVGVFIPAGRTSLVKRGDQQLQVQTEYAYRPYPRITTTILNGGQVLHKLEKRLERPIESVEEQNIAEDVIKRQHLEVIALIGSKYRERGGSAEETMRMSREEVERRTAEEKRAQETVEKIEAWEHQPRPYPGSPELQFQPPTDRPADLQLSNKQAPPVQPESIYERCSSIPGFEYAYGLTLNGLFKSENAEKEFKRSFADVYKSLQEVIEVFPQKRGKVPRRDDGVIEILRDRLYLVSTGEDLYFVSVRPAGKGLNYEKIIRNTLMPDELVVYLQQKGLSQ